MIRRELLLEIRAWVSDLLALIFMAIFVGWVIVLLAAVTP